MPKMPILMNSVLIVWQNISLLNIWNPILVISRFFHKIRMAEQSSTRQHLSFGQRWNSYIKRTLYTIQNKELLSPVQPGGCEGPEQEIRTLRLSWGSGQWSTYSIYSKEDIIWNTRHVQHVMHEFIIVTIRGRAGFHLVSCNSEWKTLSKWSQRVQKTKL